MADNSAQDFTIPGPPTVVYHHRQEWELRIIPGEGEHWPRAYTMDGSEFAPTYLSLYARTGTPPGIALIGLRVKADGAVGKKRAVTRQLPGWAAEKMNAERAARGLTDDYFAAHGAVRPTVIPVARP